MTGNSSDRQLRRLDMVLLIIFQEVMATGRVNTAAERLGLTQSAVSHGIRRLSEVMGAKLFIRCRWGVIPTDRAREMAPAVNKIVEAALELIAPVPVPGHAGKRASTASE